MAIWYMYEGAAGAVCVCVAVADALHCTTADAAVVLCARREAERALCGGSCTTSKLREVYLLFGPHESRRTRARSVRVRVSAIFTCNKPISGCLECWRRQRALGGVNQI